MQKTLHDFLVLPPSVQIFKIFLYKVGTWAIQSSIYIFTVPFLKTHDFFFLSLIPERLQKISNLGLALPGSMANISKHVARQAPLSCTCYY